ncbi:hypothetical protein MY5147_001320 [Beauveria neobassiana]
MAAIYRTTTPVGSVSRPSPARNVTDRVAEFEFERLKHLGIECEHLLVLFREDLEKQTIDR